MFASTFIVALLGTYITEKIVEPNLGKYDTNQASINLGEQKMETITDTERKAMKYAGLSVLIVCAIIALLVVPENAPASQPNDRLNCWLTIFKNQSLPLSLLVLLFLVLFMAM